MSREERRLEIDEVGQRHERGVDLGPGQAPAPGRLGGQHRVPRRDVAESGGERRSGRDEPPAELRVVPAAGAPPDDGGHRVDAAQAVEHLGVAGERHDPGGESDPLAAELARHATAVPAGVRLAERGDDGLAESELGGQPLGDLAVRRRSGRPGPRQVDERVGHHPGAGERRAAGADAAHRMGEELRPARGVEGEEPRPGRKLVAEPVRCLTGIAHAADPAQQRHVVDIGQLPLREAEVTTECHREQARPQDVLHRLTHPEIACQRERGHELGEASLRPCGRARARRGGVGAHPGAPPAIASSTAAIDPAAGTAERIAGARNATRRSAVPSMSSRSSRARPVPVFDSR